MNVQTASRKKKTLVSEKYASAQEPGMRLQVTKTKKRKQPSAASTRWLAEKLVIARERGRLEKSDLPVHQERGGLEKSMSMRLQTARTKKRRQASDDFSRRYLSGPIARETGGRLYESRSMPDSSQVGLDESWTIRMLRAKAKKRKHSSFLEMAVSSEKMSTYENDLMRKVAQFRESFGTEVSRSDREIICLDDSDDEDAAPDIEVRFKNQIDEESDSEVIVERELTVNEIVKKTIRDAEAKGNVIVL
jgi:hypothetical protein